MPRYFFHIKYKGTAYGGFQKQHNTSTIESVVQTTIQTYFKKNPPLQFTGASRTDAGVHAHHNVIHIDFENPIEHFDKHCYHLNAMLPKDIVVQGIQAVKPNVHARFDAISRTYQYFIYTQKNPFLNDVATYFPYPINHEELEVMASFIVTQTNFASFCKKHSQNFTTICKIHECFWTIEPQQLRLQIKANRFLRGMVRAIVSTMLYCAKTPNTGVVTLKQYFDNPILASAKFDVPPHGLFLTHIDYPNACFDV